MKPRSPRGEPRSLRPMKKRARKQLEAMCWNVYVNPESRDAELRAAASLSGDLVVDGAISTYVVAAHVLLTAGKNAGMSDEAAQEAVLSGFAQHLHDLITNKLHDPTFVAALMLDHDDAVTTKEAA